MAGPNAPSSRHVADEEMKEDLSRDGFVFGSNDPNGFNLSIWALNVLGFYYNYKMDQLRFSILALNGLRVLYNYTDVLDSTRFSTATDIQHFSTQETVWV